MGPRQTPKAVVRQRPRTKAAVALGANTVRAQEPGYPRPVTIACACCGKHCNAQVAFYAGDPWPDFIHECEHCGYINMESEWSEVTCA